MQPTKPVSPLSGLSSADGGAPFNTNGSLSPNSFGEIATSARRSLSLRLDTLAGQFTTLSLVAGLLAIIALITTFIVLDNTNQNFKRIVSDSAPSITTALELGQAVQDIDAKAADYQLTARIDVTSPDFNAKVYGQSGLRAAAWNTFLQHREKINDLLFKARQNITYPGEADAVDAITQRYFDYIAKINVMRYELDQGHRENALAAYKAAHDILVGNLGNVPLDAEGHSPEEQAKLRNWDGDKFDTKKQYLGIEANIQKLYQLNYNELKKARDTARQITGISFIATIIVSVALILSLLVLCGRDAIITHRLINPGYWLAFLLAIGLGLPLIMSLGRAGDDYKSVADDAFASIAAAASARQMSADGNADESRVLLSPQSPGLDSTSPALTPDVKLAFSKAILKTSFDKKQAIVLEELKTAWGNVTYAGEREALCKITQNNNPNYRYRCPDGTSFALDQYLSLDGQIRKSLDNNLLAEAINLNVGASNQFYETIDGVLVQLAKVNQTEFDKTTCNALGKTSFGGSCNNIGYIPFLQLAILILYPLIIVAVAGGYFYRRNEF